MSDAIEQKKAAALRAVEEVQSDMIVGLGTGSTAAFAVERIGELWKAGELSDLVCVATSEETAEQARSYDLPLVAWDSVDELDIAIDGADEVDPDLNLIKGMGGALLREKAVERKARRFIVICDDSKLVERLGERSPLPVEIDPGRQSILQTFLETRADRAELRTEGNEPFVTDNGNFIIDLHFDSGIPEPRELAVELDAREGVREHGLFLDMADEVFVGGAEGMRATG